MQGSAARVCLTFLVAILLTLLYPALFLDCRIAPEASLKSAPPWRELSGPLPKPSAEAFDAATQLGPRLASVARDPLGDALWNPWIGGGRPGWIAGPEEGGAPLVFLAATVARRGWAWTGLIALELAAALLSAWWALRFLGLGAWPAAVGATAYALSGAVSGHWLDWRGSALALGPLALMPAIRPPRGLRRRAGLWALTLLVLAACGAPAMSFVALAAALAIVRSPRGQRLLLLLPAALAAVLVVGAALPRIWLTASGGEPGAPSPASVAEPPIRSWAAAIAPQAAPDAPSIQSAAGRLEARPDNFGFVGLGAVALAALGFLAAPPRTRGFWLGVATVSAAAVALPGGLLARFGVAQRPYGVLAFAVAALAAHGTQALSDRFNGQRAAAAIAPAVWILLALSLVANAARHLPYVFSDDTDLPVPIPTSADTKNSRLVGVLGALPPDTAALLGLADVRASSFPREPLYSAMVGGGAGVDIPVSRAVSARMVRLGARWILEPLPLHVVSGEVFSRVEIAEAARIEGPAGQTYIRFRALVPSGATRLGLPSEAGRRVRARLGSTERSAELPADGALQSESAAWTWFAVPPDTPPGSAVLTLSAERPLPAAALPVAWDTSGLLLGPEGRGIRVWEWARVRPLVFLARGVIGEDSPPSPDLSVVTVPASRLSPLRHVSGATGSVTVARVGPGAIEARADLTSPGLLVFQVKCRPSLRNAVVNGSPVPTEPVDGVWTGVALPAGRSRVELKAQLPPLIWGSAAAAFIASVLLAVPRRLP